MGESPILLVGSERSGTTLLRLMLDSHPELAFIEEFEYVVEKIEDDKLPTTDAFARFVAGHRIFQSSGFAINPTLDFSQMANGFMEARRAAKQARRVGATVHYGFAKAPALWPNATYIHLVRDPRNVAPSIMKMGWAHDVWNAMDKWMEAEEDWNSFVSSLDSNQHLTIRFEDLLEDYETVLQMCATSSALTTPTR